MIDLKAKSKKVDYMIMTPVEELDRPPVPAEEQAEVARLTEGALTDPDSCPVPESVAVLYAVSFAVAERVEQSQIGALLSYVGKLHEAGHSEFAALILRLVFRRDDQRQEIQQKPAYVDLMVGDLGKLIAGEVE